MKRFFAFFLVIAIMISLVSCNSRKQENVETTESYTKPQTTEIKMGKGNLSLYFSISDSLNPYEAISSGNQDLTSLLFDGLTKLDSNLNPQLMIAKKIELIGKKCDITLKNVTFSDGSSVTAEDVTYSIGLAKNSTNALYNDQLKNISYYSAASSSVVELTLKHYDRNIAAILDFPIIKKGSTSRKNSDNKDLPPIGAGRYIYNDDSGVYTLKGNADYYGNVPKNTVYLVNTPDSDSLDYYIRLNEVDIYYSGIAIEDLPSMSGQISKVKQTNLIYLGINSNAGILKNKHIRQAVSQLIDRKEICESAYYGYADAAVSIYNSGLEISKNYENIFEKTKNIKKSIEQLNKGGYNKDDDSGYYINNNSKRIVLTLLYNKDNGYQSSAATLIKKQLKQGGIEVKTNGVSLNSYSAAVKNGNYDFYFGEIKLNKNFDLTAMLNSNLICVETTAKATAKTTKPNTTDATSATIAQTDDKYTDISATYSDYLKGDIELGDFIDKFIDEMPFIPIGYRTGVVSCNSSVSPTAVATASDAYYNIELLSVK